MDLRRFGTMVLFTTPSAVELSVWMGDFPCGHPILMRACRRGIMAELGALYKCARAMRPSCWSREPRRLGIGLVLCSSVTNRGGDSWT